MSRKIVELKYLGRMDVPDERDGHRDQTVIEELLDLIDRGEIYSEGWHNDHGFDIDNHDDDDSTLAEDETIFAVRIEIPFEKEDYYHEDLAGELLKYIANTLTETDLNGLTVHRGHISNCHEREDGPYVKTVIEITVK